MARGGWLCWFYRKKKRKTRVPSRNAQPFTDPLETIRSIKENPISLESTKQRYPQERHSLLDPVETLRLSRDPQKLRPFARGGLEPPSSTKSRQSEATKWIVTGFSITLVQDKTSAPSISWAVSSVEPSICMESPSSPFQPVLEGYPQTRKRDTPSVER